MELIINQWKQYTIYDSYSMVRGITMVVTWFPKTYRHKVRIGVHELMKNAIEHGVVGLGSKRKYELKRKGVAHYNDYLEQRLKESKNRKVDVKYEKNEMAVKLTISDYGQGFDWKDVLAKEKSGTQKDGLGVLVSYNLFDELIYNDIGNTVTAVIYK
jgi:anti-sigma regulatory factor (Ser/Thr protein kinase)